MCDVRSGWFDIDIRILTIVSWMRLSKFVWSNYNTYPMRIGDREDRGA